MSLKQGGPSEQSMNHLESDCSFFGETSCASQRFRWHRRDSLTMTMGRDSLAMLVKSWTVPVSRVDGVLVDRTGDRKSNMFILYGVFDGGIGIFGSHFNVEVC